MLQRIYGASLPDAEGARRVPQAAGGGAGARPPQARQGARPLRLPPLGAGLAVLPPEGRGRSTTACSSTCARSTRSAATRRSSRRRSSTPSSSRPPATTPNYRENMFFTEVDEREFGVKPMNCPGHFLLFQTRHWSYRDLPVRFADFGRLHRYELSGVTAGPDARADVLAGRRPHLHAVRADRGRDLRVPRVPRRRLRRLRLHGRRDLASACGRRSASAPTSSGTAARRALAAALEEGAAARTS